MRGTMQDVSLQLNSKINEGQPGLEGSRGGSSSSSSSNDDDYEGPCRARISPTSPEVCTKYITPANFNLTRVIRPVIPD